MRDSAFRENVVRELGVLLRVARRLTREPETAENLVQETLIRVSPAVDRVDGRYHRARRRLRTRLEGGRVRPRASTSPMSGQLMRRRGRWGCRGIHGLLQGYVDGETVHSAALLVTGHLDDCRRCGLEADAYRALIAATARLSPPADHTRLERLRRFANELISTA